MNSLIDLMSTLTQTLIPVINLIFTVSIYRNRNKDKEIDISFHHRKIHQEKVNDALVSIFRSVTETRNCIDILNSCSGKNYENDEAKKADIQQRLNAFIEHHNATVKLYDSHEILLKPEIYKILEELRKCGCNTISDVESLLSTPPTSNSAEWETQNILDVKEGYKQFNLEREKLKKAIQDELNNN